MIINVCFFDWRSFNSSYILNDVPQHEMSWPKDIVEATFRCMSFFIHHTYSLGSQVNIRGRNEPQKSWFGSVRSTFSTNSIHLNSTFSIFLNISDQGWKNYLNPFLLGIWSIWIDIDNEKWNALQKKVRSCLKEWLTEEKHSVLISISYTHFKSVIAFDFEDESSEVVRHSTVRKGRVT